MEANSEGVQPQTAPSVVDETPAVSEGTMDETTAANTASDEGVVPSDSIAAAASINVLETYLQNFNEELSSTTTTAAAAPSGDTQSQDQLEQVAQTALSTECTIICLSLTKQIFRLFRFSTMKESSLPYFYECDTKTSIHYKGSFIFFSLFVSCVNPFASGIKKVLLYPITGLFSVKIRKTFLAIKHFSVNDTMSGQPNKCLIH